MKFKNAYYKKMKAFVAGLLLTQLIYTDIFAQDGYIARKKDVKLMIDPAAKSGGLASDFLDGVEFIPLETNDRCMLGSIDQLEVTDKYFIVLDKQTNAIYIFNRSGKFLRRIEGRNVGYKGEERMYAFYYNRYDEMLEIPYRQYLVSFRLDGTNAGRKEAPYKGSFYIHSGTDRKAYYAYRVNERYKDSVAYELILTNGTGGETKYWPYNMKSAMLKSRDVISGGHLNFYFNNDSSTFFVRPYDYTVYEVQADALLKACEFVFPLHNSLPAGFSADSTYSGRRIPYLEEKKDIIFGLSNVFKIGNNFFFKTLDYSKSETYVYNLSSGRLLCVSNITPDELSFFLHITDSPIGGVDFRNKSFLARDANSVYTSYSALMFSRNEATHKIGKSFPAALAAFFDNRDHKSGNPVIVRLKFKSVF